MTRLEQEQANATSNAQPDLVQQVAEAQNQFAAALQAYKDLCNTFADDIPKHLDRDGHEVEPDEKPFSSDNTKFDDFMGRHDDNVKVYILVLLK